MQPLTPKAQRADLLLILDAALAALDAHETKYLDAVLDGHPDHTGVAYQATTIAGYLANHRSQLAAEHFDRVEA